MTTNETAVFIDQIVHLHHSGEKVHARVLIQALESACQLNTSKMNSLYRKIEVIERELPAHKKEAAALASQ